MFPPGSGVPQSAQGMAAGIVQPVTSSLLHGIDSSSVPSGYVVPHSVAAAMKMNPSVPSGPMQGKLWMQPNPQVGGGPAKMWHSQPQQTQPQQRQQQNDVKHREYLKQQQRLKAMAFSSSKGVSADALIGNLLEKKDTFKPKLNHQPTAPIPMQASHVPQQMTSQISKPTTPGAVVGCVQISDDLPGWLTIGSSRLPPLYAHIWSLVSDPSSGGALVDTNKILALLLTSNLPKEVLGYIWNLATNGTNGQLNQQQLYITLALVAMAQSGCTFNNLNVLNLVPQPPIPTFNMNVPKPPSENKIRRSDLNLPPSQPPISTPQPISLLAGASSSATLPLAIAPAMNSTGTDDDFGDEFTDFQSAEIIDAPALSSVPSTLPSTAVIQPVITAKQVVSDLNQSVVAKLGRNQGRSIGSRLANHTLGAPTKTRSHHHKHRRASADRDNLYMDAEVTFGSEKSHGLPESLSWKGSDKRYPQHDYSEHEDFNDFQVAAGLNVNVDELFPRCNPKVKKPNLILKESAIRNDSEDEEQKQSQTETELLSLDSPPPLAPPTALPVITTVTPVVPSVACPPTLPIVPSAIPPVLPPILPSNIVPVTQPIAPPALPPPAAEKTTKDFMGVEEDRYSALRFIEMEGQSSKNRNDSECLADEFGDFVSADDSFAEIASREQPSFTKESLPALDVGWQTPVTQSIEFPVDDWSSKDLFETTSVLPNQPVVSTESKVFSENLSTEFLKLDITTGAGTVDSAPKLITNTPSWNFDLVTGKDTPELDMTPILNENEVSHDDEFGDFVGPESTWVDDSVTISSPGVLGDCTWTDTGSAKVAPGLFSDNRSVSSLELPGVTLSRHGSLPSLDLKLFSNNDDSMDKVNDNTQVADWIRCLDSCLSLLQAACNTFTSISCHDVVMEVLGTSEGRSYFINLLEVHSVSWRIQRSYQRAGHESNQLDSLLTSIRSSWSLLQPFYKLANINMAADRFGSDEENGQPVCGVCGSPANNGVIEYGGHTYHATCANLWLNCVNRTLPAHSSLS